MRLFRWICAFLALTLWSGAGFAREVKLTADSMQYDSASGYFTASENVKIVREGIVATARKAEGNMSGGELNLIGDVHILGVWEDEKVDIKGQILTGYLQEPRGVSFKGTVQGIWGSRQIDAEDLRTRGDAFSVAKLRRYADTAEGFSFSCNTIEGKLKDGEIVEFTAVGAFRFLSSPKRGTPTEIRGDKAVYSKARGSLVVNGNVTAVQNGRSLRSDALVYFPAQNRIEATGKPQLIFKLDEGSSKK